MNDLRHLRYLVRVWTVPERALLAVLRHSPCASGEAELRFFAVHLYFSGKIVGRYGDGLSCDVCDKLGFSAFTSGLPLSDDIVRYAGEFCCLLVSVLHY